MYRNSMKMYVQCNNKIHGYRVLLRPKFFLKMRCHSFRLAVDVGERQHAILFLEEFGAIQHETLKIILAMIM